LTVTFQPWALVHGTGWGDAKVDRTVRFASYLTRIVETGLAPA
jgi:hypothetical protein